MKKYSTSYIAKRVIFTGGTLFIIGIAIGFVANWSTYGKVNDCLNKICSLGWEQKVGDISAITCYVGLGIVGIGLLYFLYAKAIKKSN